MGGRRRRRFYDDGVSLRRRRCLRDLSRRRRGSRWYKGLALLQDKGRICGVQVLESLSENAVDDVVQPAVAVRPSTSSLPLIFAGRRRIDGGGGISGCKSRRCISRRRRGLCRGSCSGRRQG